MRTRYVALVVVLVLWSMSTHGKPSAAGDEPHYLMITQSLVDDGDLDLANNYAAGEGVLVGADGLEAGPHVRVNLRGASWSTHDIGLAVLVLPAYVAGSWMASHLPETTLARFRMSRGRFAYSVVAFFMISLTVLGAVLFNLSLQRVASPWRAAAVTLAVTLSPPILAHSFLIFPEVPAFSVACAVVWVAMTPSNQMTLTRFTAVALALGLTPWIHRKFSFFVLGLLVVLLHRHAVWLRRQRPGWLAASLIEFAAPQAALHAVTFAAWGNLGGPQMLNGLPFSLGGAWVGMAGLLVDRSRGLLPYAPIYLLAPLAWWVAGRRYRDWLLPAALLYFPLAAFTTWGAGYSPAARFLVPLMPLVALPAAEALGRRWFVRAAIPPLLVQIVIVGAAWHRPRILWPDDPATNRALSAVPLVGPALNRLAPALDRGSWRN